MSELGHSNLLEEKQVSREMGPYRDIFSEVFGKGFTLIWLNGLSAIEYPAKVSRFSQPHDPLI